MKVRLFGMLRQIVGEATVTAPGDLTTVEAVESWLISTYPGLAPHRGTWRVAVDQEYVGSSAPVSDKSELAVIPPVSGGRDVFVELIDRDIDPAEWRLLEAPSDCGGVAEFLGIVRGTENGAAIEALFYEVYPGMTEKELDRVARETMEAFPIRLIRVVHRHGRIAVGEGALWIQVMSGHRAEAFEAVEHCIRRIKEVVPIWKVEAADS